MYEHLRLKTTPRYPREIPSHVSTRGYSVRLLVAHDPSHATFGVAGRHTGSCHQGRGAAVANDPRSISAAVTLPKLCRSYWRPCSTNARIDDTTVRYPLDCYRCPMMAAHSPDPRGRLKILVSAVQSRPCPPLFFVTTDRGMPARSRFRTAERRRSWVRSPPPRLPAGRHPRSPERLDRPSVTSASWPIWYPRSWNPPGVICPRTTAGSLPSTSGRSKSRRPDRGGAREGGASGGHEGAEHFDEYGRQQLRSGKHREAPRSEDRGQVGGRLPVDGQTERYQPL
jgi:hypothetical protein